MPAFGDGIFTPEQIGASGRPCPEPVGQGHDKPRRARFRCSPTTARRATAPPARATARYGAPNLADAIWLYGGDPRGRDPPDFAPAARRDAGVVTAGSIRVTIRMLAAYVHSLGGGEQFVDAAAQPATGDEQP